MALPDNTPINMTAGADLSAKKFRFGKLSAGLVVACSVSGERADGIIGGGFPTANASGAGVDLQIERIMKVECGGSFSAGDPLTTDANGKAILATGGAYINAYALDDGASGRFVTCIPPRANAPIVQNVANSVAAGTLTLGTPQVIAIDLADAATATTVYTNADKIEILDVWAIKDGAGAANTVQVTDSADAAITNAMAFAVDKTVTHAGTIDKAKRVLAAAAGFKVVNTRAAGSSAGQLFLLVVKRA